MERRPEEVISAKAMDEDDKPKFIRPRRKVVEIEPVSVHTESQTPATPSSSSPVEQEIELPKRRNIRAIEEVHIPTAEVIPTKKRPYVSPREFEGIIENEGVLEIMAEGYGFLRSLDYNYLEIRKSSLKENLLIQWREGLKK